MIKKIKFPDGSIKTLKVPDDMPKEQLMGIVQKIAAGQIQKQGGQPKQESWADRPEYKQTALGQEYPIRREIEKVARNTLTGVGMGVGGAVGVASGLALGGGNPVSGSIGGVYGAGLGHGITANISDRIHELLGLSEGMNLEESTIKAVLDVKSGMEMEMGGGAIFGAVTGLKRIYDKVKGWLDISDSAALAKAGEIMSEIFNKDPNALKTAEATDKVLKRMGVKTKPTVAQKTNSKTVGLMEQRLSTESDEMAEGIITKRDEIRGEAQAGLEKKLGGGNVSDTMSALEKHKASIEQKAAAAKAEADEIIAPIYGTKTEQGIGEDIYGELVKSKAAAKEIVDTEYAKLPEGIVLKNKPIVTAAKEVVEEFKVRGGGKDSIPSDLLKQIGQKTKETEGVSFDTLREWRSWIGEEKADAIRAGNLKLSRRLSILKKGVQETMDQMENTGDAAVAAQYKKATTLFDKYYAAFRERKKGTVGKIVPQAGESRGALIGDSDIPKKFFTNADKADDLIRAVGPEKASAVIDDYAGFTLANVINKGAGPTKGWLAGNKAVLKKYGLYDKYKNMVNKMEVSDAIQAELAQYNKTVASRALDTNAGDFIEEVFTKSGGVKKSATIMNDLLNHPGIKGNEAAINGIKTGFKDFLLKKSKSHSGDADTNVNPVHLVSQYGKMLEKYSDAINVLYRDEPSKVRALKDYHKILGYMQRNMKKSAAGGSTTAEKQANITDELVSSGMQMGAVRAGAGWLFNSTVKFAKALKNFPAKMRQPQIDEFLRQALLDPDAAAVLMDGAKKSNTKQFKQNIWRHAISMGIVQVKNKVDELTEENQGPMM